MVQKQQIRTQLGLADRSGNNGPIVAAARGLTMVYGLPVGQQVNGSFVRKLFRSGLF